MDFASLQRGQAGIRFRHVKAPANLYREATYFGKVRDLFSHLSRYGRRAESSVDRRGYHVRAPKLTELILRELYVVICSLVTRYFRGCAQRQLENSPEIYTLSQRSK